MSRKDITIDVFYIAYLKKGACWGLEAVKNFFNSYQKHPAGVIHNLIVLARNWENNLDDYEKLKEICSLKNIRIIETVDEGIDYGAYYIGAKNSTSTHMFCMNTTCEIQVDNWLVPFINLAKKEEKYKLISNSGFWEICHENEESFAFELIKSNFSSNIAYYYNKYLLYFNALKRIDKIVKNLFLPIKFIGFPNYAVRTAAFFIERNIYEEFMNNVGLPKNKQEAYSMENGQKSLSNFILNSGYDYCVVDKFGKKFEKEDFDKSNTFRSEIKNYIIKDKQTILYEEADWLFKMYLRKICWGKI